LGFFFQQIDQQEDWGRRVQNPQPSDLSIGIQWDGCPLSGPGISVPSQTTTPGPSQDAPRRSNPSWAGSVSSVEFAKIPCGPSRSAKTR
jgi:hypothetical protein